MKPTPQQKLSRALWLAFQVSVPMGMGVLHSKETAKATEAILFAETKQANQTRIDTDYVFGRMMKTRFSVTPNGDLELRPEIPRNDYQSWATTYPTATDLINAVEESFT